MLRHGRRLLCYAFAHSASICQRATCSRLFTSGSNRYSELSSLYVRSFFVGILLDRLNKSYVLLSGILLNVFSIFLLSIVQSILEIMLYRALTGVAHALFWPSCEVLISINSSMDKRVRNISVFIAAWILGFMVGPIIGKLALNVFDLLHSVPACCYHHGGRNCAINTFALLRLAGCPKRSGSSSKLCRASQGNGYTSNTCRSHTIQCNDVWSSSCSVPCVYERRIAHKPRRRANVLRFWYVAFCYSSTACDKDIEVRCAWTYTGCFDYCSRYDHFFFVKVDSVVCSINCVIRPFD